MQIVLYADCAVAQGLVVRVQEEGGVESGWGQFGDGWGDGVLGGGKGVSGKFRWALVVGLFQRGVRWR